MPAEVVAWPAPAASLAGAAPARSAAAPPRPSVIDLVGQARDRRRERSPSGGAVVRTGPASSSSRSCRTRVPRSSVSSSWRWNSGIRFIRPLAELVPDERHRPADRRDRGAALVRRPDDAHRDLGVAQIRLRLDAGDGREPDLRVVDLPGQDRRDLLPSSSSIRRVRVSAVLDGCAAAHSRGERRLARRRPRRLG